MISCAMSALPTERVAHEFRAARRAMAGAAVWLGLIGFAVSSAPSRAEAIRIDALKISVPNSGFKRTSRRFSWTRSCCGRMTANRIRWPVGG